MADTNNISDGREYGGICGGDTVRRQHEVALAMIRSGLSLSEVVAESSVTEEEFAEWISEGSFPEYVARLAGGFAEADAPYIWDVLLRLAKEGSVPAIRLYFDIRAKKTGGQRGTSCGTGQAVSGASLDSLRQSIFDTSEEEQT